MQSTAPDMEHYVETAKGEARQVLAPIRPTTLAGRGQKVVHAHEQDGAWILDRSYAELTRWHHNGELELLVCTRGLSEIWLQFVSATKYQAQDAFLFSSVVPGTGSASLCTFVVYADGTASWGTGDVGGSAIVIKGYATAQEISAMHGMGEGDVWGLTDNGVIVRPGRSSLQVQAGDLVQWDGSTWQMFLHLDLTNYVTEQELQSQVDILAAADTALQRDISAEELARENADVALQERIDTHSGRTDNPHNVTAAQVGAATSSDLLRMTYAATNTLKFYRGTL